MALRTFGAIPEQNFPHNSGEKIMLAPLVAFLVILFVLTLLVLQARGMYDVNRLYNPNYASCVNQLESLDCNNYYFFWNRALNWSYVAVPLFAIYLALALTLRKKKHIMWQKGFFRALVFLTFLNATLIAVYISHFLFTFHRMLAWYVLFGAAAALILALVIYLDRRNRKKSEPEEAI